MSAPLAVFIVDDEAPARTRLRFLLDDCRPDLPNRLLGEADNGPDALRQLAETPADVVLLDIQMPQMNGLIVARHLLRFPAPPAVIFVTAHDEHAVAAFEVGVLDYLLKPVRLPRLVQALQRARPLRAEDDATLRPLAPRRHFTVSDRGRVWLVPLEDVLYLRAEQKYVTLRTHAREYLLSEALARIEEEFPDTLLRVHRNCLVNHRHLVGFELRRQGGESHWEAVLRDWPERLPVSRRQHAVVKAFRAFGA